MRPYSISLSLTYFIQYNTLKVYSVAANSRISFSLVAEYYCIVCVCGGDHIFFIHSSTDGYLDCFHILAIVNNAAITTVV